MNFSKKNIWRALLLLHAVLFFVLYHDLFSLDKIYSHDAIIWYGSFHYYVENLASGHFPYWDPYLSSGTFFYPNISLLGLLDPLVLVAVILKKVTGVLPLTLYIYFRIVRLFILVAGAYLFFSYITQCRISALVSAGIMLLALPHSYFAQNSAVDLVYLTPYALYLWLRFLEEPSGNRKYLYLMGIALCTGISMNIFIPAYYLFNLLIFISVSVALQWKTLRETFGSYLNKRSLFFSSIGLAVILMMSAPPLTVMLRDASSGGELFPMQRIIQKNDRVFKKIMASDIDRSSLSDEFTDRKGVFNSWGSLVGIIYPDIVKSFDYWGKNDFVSYMHQYIGIIPFILCVIGFIYHKSKHKYLIALMMLLIYVNGYSFSGVHGIRYNFLQKIFNGVFPPLKMLEVREPFAIYFLLYLCTFLSLGISIFIKEDPRAFLSEKYSRILAIAVSVIGIKAVISAIFAGKIFFVSSYDFAVLLQVVIFSFMSYFYARHKLAGRFFYALLLGVILTDLGAYNLLYKADVLRDSRGLYSMLETGESIKKTKGDFEYFKQPLYLSAATGGLAFEESIHKTKGSLSAGFNHSLFTTKRFYDLLTHVPPVNQFILEGVVFPIIQFFPADRVENVSDKHMLMNYYSSAAPTDIEGRLFIENPSALTAGVQPMKSFDQYEDVPWLTPQDIFGSYSSFIAANGESLEKIRNNLGSLLNNQLFSAEVNSFTVNEITIGIRNRGKGYLVYNDGWSKYWQAFDGDRELPVKIANYNSKAVELEAGEHVIKFIFNPVHYKIGLILYYAGLFVCLALIILCYFKAGDAPFSSLKNMKEAP